MKKLLFVLSLLIASVSFAQTSSIGGVVTYFFNDYQGDKPDIGAKVYIINKEFAPDFKINLAYNFSRGKTYRNLYATYLNWYLEKNEAAKKYEGKKRHKEKYDKLMRVADEYKSKADELYSTLVDIGVETKEKFDALNDSLFKPLVLIRYNENTSVKTIGSTGEFSINVLAGTYYVYIVSNNRKTMNTNEINGNIHVEEITVKENQSKDVSYNFDIN